jgi:hypothetical protein
MLSVLGVCNETLSDERHTTNHWQPFIAASLLSWNLTAQRQ